MIIGGNATEAQKRQLQMSVEGSPWRRPGFAIEYVVYFQRSSTGQRRLVTFSKPGKGISEALQQ